MEYAYSGVAPKDVFPVNVIYFLFCTKFTTYINRVIQHMCECLHRTGMFEVYNRVKTTIVFTDVYLVDNMYNVET